MIPPCLNLICQIGFWENQSGRKRKLLTKKKKGGGGTTLKMMSVIRSGALYFTVMCDCARSTFLTAKITVLHQQIYPKRCCETGSLLFNPHASLLS